MDKKIEVPGKELPKIPKGPKPPVRPSQDEVRQNAAKWAFSPGLQPPK